MGRETLLFVGTTELLADLFPGWKPAVRPPVTRVETNPFTGKPMTIVIDAEEYGEDETLPADFEWASFAALGAPSISQTISSTLLRAAALDLGIDRAACERALSEPPTSEACVFEVDPSLVGALAEASTARLGALAAKVLPHVPAEGSRTIFFELAELARKAHAKRKNVYLVEQA